MSRVVAWAGLGLAVALSSTASLAAPVLTGFKELGTGEIIEIRRPLFQSGKLRVGNATGRVQRDAVGRTLGQRVGSGSYEESRRFGRTRFSVTGSDVRGTLSGECRYDRLEQRVAAKGWSVAAPAEPLGMHCEFTRDGTAIGYLRLQARPMPLKLVQVTQREGEVEVSGTHLRLRSGHRLGDRGVPTSDPVGYWLEDASGQRVAAVDLNGATRVRVALPNDRARRDAALAAGLALAVFWDPGDTDD